MIDFEIGNISIGQNHKPFIIAEMSGNHNQSLERALEIVEAAAASRVIVTTNVPGCRDGIIPNKTGLLAPIQNPKKLADVLQYLIEHPKLRLAMGKAGRKLAEKQFTIEKIIHKHLNVYKELINNYYKS